MWQIGPIAQYLLSRCLLSLDDQPCRLNGFNWGAPTTPENTGFALATAQLLLLNRVSLPSKGHQTSSGVHPRGAPNPATARVCPRSEASAKHGRPMGLTMCQHRLVTRCRFVRRTGFERSKHRARWPIPTWDQEKLDHEPPAVPSASRGQPKSNNGQLLITTGRGKPSVSEIEHARDFFAAGEVGLKPGTDGKRQGRRALKPPVRSGRP